ncbi:MAG TPA: nickel pincer cofactor biosynthesis protein LarC [Jiangellaceae bacterium]|nr:nickel pincer cofactor biosynthesis protein LarC [Jiangellaceae bacterium]
MTTADHAWLDLTAGVAGDMLLGALVDAGADLGAIQQAVDAVVPDSVRLHQAEVVRGGQRAVAVRVDVLVPDPPYRTWATIRSMLTAAVLAPVTRDRAEAVFARLAAAEGQVHGTDPEDMHFHEVGALDSIADVVGCCEAVRLLGIVSVSGSPIALGSGRIRTAHGDLPVPVPAVAQLAQGWEVTSGGIGELATPTGVALVRTLADRCEQLPAQRLAVMGVGAGSTDTPGRPNVVRVAIGTASADSAPELDAAVQLEANIDDLDPRLWPGVLDALLRAGASDAWLTPILMKKGRPAHTLSVLCPPALAPAIRELIFAQTSTLGIRDFRAGKQVLPRRSVPVAVRDGEIRITVAVRDGVIVQATPEFDDVAALANRYGVPIRVVLHEAIAAAETAGLVVGAAG